MKKLLTIAGSDSSGGAGIQADLKTFDAFGAYGMSCICALTAQNTQGVTMVANTDPSMVRAQLAAVYEDIVPDAVKTGMLSTPDIVRVVAEFLRERNTAPLVVDPVMVATTGAVLLEDRAVEYYKKDLIPLATLLTPNIPEAEVLSGLSIHTLEDMKRAGAKISESGVKAVLIKGGHRIEEATDLLYVDGEVQVFREERIDTKNTHGTGCTLSAALAACLAEGDSLEEAVRRAKEYLTGALRQGATLSIGHGYGPVAHLWRMKL